MKKFFLITIFLLAYSSAHACMVPMSAKEKFEHSDYVFTGKMFGCSQKNNSKKFKISVRKIWKGEPVPVFETTTSCSSNLLENDVDYLIYGADTGTDGVIKVFTPGSSCLRSTKLISYFEASIKNFFSMFDGVPGKADHRIHDFEYLGKPQHIIQKDNKE